MKPNRPYKDYPDPIDDAPAGGTPDYTRGQKRKRFTMVAAVAIAIVLGVFLYAVTT